MHMERVQLPLLPCTKGPGFTIVQECAQDTGSIDLDLGICCQLLLSRTLFVSLENVVPALPMRLSSSTKQNKTKQNKNPRQVLMSRRKSKFPKEGWKLQISIPRAFCFFFWNERSCCHPADKSRYCRSELQKEVTADVLSLTKEVQEPKIHPYKMDIEIVNWCRTYWWQTRSSSF